MKGKYDPTIHRDGTVTYWSVYQQVWIERAAAVPAAEMAAMDPGNRDRISPPRRRERGRLASRPDCPACGGTGSLEYLSYPRGGAACYTCDGSGKVARAEKGETNAQNH